MPIFQELVASNLLLARHSTAVSSIAWMSSGCAEIFCRLHSMNLTNETILSMDLSGVFWATVVRRLTRKPLRAMNLSNQPLLALKMALVESSTSRNFCSALRLIILRLTRSPCLRMEKTHWTSLLSRSSLITFPPAPNNLIQLESFSWHFDISSFNFRHSRIRLVQTCQPKNGSTCNPSRPNLQTVVTVTW